MNLSNVCILLKYLLVYFIYNYKIMKFINNIEYLILYYQGL